MADLKPMGASGIPVAYQNECEWSSTVGVRCDSDDVTLDHVLVTGGLYWTGNGTLTITNSIVEGGVSFYVIAVHSPKPSTVAVSDSTLYWPSSMTYPTGIDVGVIDDGSGVGVTMLLHRDDISGMPQGVDPDGDNSVIDSCYIHGLIHTGVLGQNNTHVDGIFAMGGNNLLVQRSYVDVRNQYVGGQSWATAAFFAQDSVADTGYRLLNNCLAGGSYVFYNQAAANADVENNVISDGVYGPVNVEDLGSTGTWTNNVDGMGMAIPKPGK